MIALPAIPRELRTLMAEIGPRWREDATNHVKLMVEHFSAVLRQAPRDAVETRPDIAYGAHPRQRFDLYLPASGGTKRPALIFIHGGAFTDGDRNRTDAIYSNVSLYFARHGVVGINAGYRMAPEATWPEGSRDVGAVVAWVREHADEHGIDPARIFLMGHSAGGAHVASYAYDKRLHPAAGPGLAGLIVVSGRVRADNLPENHNAKKVEAYYGSDSSRFDDRSGVSHVGPDSVPTFIAWSQYENPLLDVYCAELAWRLADAKRRAPPVMVLEGHNHTSIIGSFNTAEDALGRALLHFFAEPR